MLEQAMEIVVSDPDVLHGQARIRKTRIPVSVVLDCLGAGMSERDILAEYPSLSPEAIRASIRYAAAMAREEIVPIPAGNDPG